jgi:SAM-dependent methyltransferase
MDQISRAVVVPELINAWLPAIDGVVARLVSGGRVADVGCGFGAAAIAIAESFPQSQCFGIDLDDASVARARSAAMDAGVANRVTFEVGPAAELDGGPFDLVVFVDSLHDFGRPHEALVTAREVLTDDGVVLLAEHAGSDRLEQNLNPIGQFFYACSALVCTPNAMADHPAGLPLGSVPGEERLRELATAAGFSRVHRLDVDAPMNLLLELRP